MRTCRRVLAPRALEHQIDAALLHDCRALGHMPAQVELRMAAKHLPPDDEEKPRRQRRLQRVHVEALQLAHAVGDPALDDAAVRPVSRAVRETQTRSAVSSSPFLALRHPRAPGPLGASPMTARSTARPPPPLEPPGTETRRAPLQPDAAGAFSPRYSRLGRALRRTWRQAQAHTAHENLRSPASSRRADPLTADPAARTPRAPSSKLSAAAYHCAMGPAAAPPVLEPLLNHSL
jgi:hypothetical protein